MSSLAIVALLLGACSSASALSLGRVRGAALMGQPLELLVSVTTEAASADGAFCADADVFHGDTRIDNSRVRVSVEPTTQADTFDIRVSSPTLIDEPVVTLYVRAGCAQKTSRRFVLLADFPGDAGGASARSPMSPMALLPPPLAAPAERLAKSGSPSTNEAPVTTPAEKPLPVPAPKPAPPTPMVKKELAPTRQAAKAEAKNPAQSAAKAPASGKARLQLDPLENLAERVKTLESTTVAAPPQEARSDVQRMQQLQLEIKALLSQAAKNESNLMVMRERLEKAESERVPMFVVYALLGLLGLLGLGMAAFVFLWTRRTQKNEWQAPVYAPVTTSPPQAGVQLHPDPSMDVDVNLMDMDDSSFSKLMGMESDAKKKPTPNTAPR